MPAKLTEIDELLRGEHLLLDPSDVCYFMREYTARAGWDHGETNNLISNFKKLPSLKGQTQYNYKLRAIRQVGVELREAVNNPKWLKKATLVPMPPSKAIGDDEFDDRMMEALQVMDGGRNIDIRRLLIQRQSMPASHTGGRRSTIQDLVHAYEVDESVASPEPEVIAVFDDLLTMGAHFRAAKIVLTKRFPRAQTVGIFIARCIWPEDPTDF